jgi:hypothetical protein
VLLHLFRRPRTESESETEHLQVWTHSGNLHPASACCRRPLPLTCARCCASKPVLQDGASMLFTRCSLSRPARWRHLFSAFDERSGQPLRRPSGLTPQHRPGFALQGITFAFGARTRQVGPPCETPHVCVPLRPSSRLPRSPSARQRAPTRVGHRCTPSQRGQPLPPPSARGHLCDASSWRGMRQRGERTASGRAGQRLEAMGAASCPQSALWRARLPRLSRVDL